MKAATWRKRVKTGAVIDEISAFSYELARRSFSLAEYPSYLKLDNFEKDIVWKCFRHRGESVAVKRDRWPKKEFEGYAFLPVSWNLRASDRALQAALLEMVKAERRRQGIKPTRNKGNRNRPVSWRWLELIDDGRKLNGADRSHRSNALKKSAELKGDFIACWAEIERARVYQ